MFDCLAQVSISLPDTTSPWFFWAVPFGLFVICFITCFVASAKLDKLPGGEGGGHIAIVVMSCILGSACAIYSGVIFFNIFRSVLPASPVS